MEWSNAKELSERLKDLVQPMIKFRQFPKVKAVTFVANSHGAVHTWSLYSNVAKRSPDKAAEIQARWDARKEKREIMKAVPESKEGKKGGRL